MLPSHLNNVEQCNNTTARILCDIHNSDLRASLINTERTDKGKNKRKSKVLCDIHVHIEFSSKDFAALIYTEQVTVTEKSTQEKTKQ